MISFGKSLKNTLSPENRTGWGIHYKMCKMCNKGKGKIYNDKRNKM